jgi:hypothetical protein
LCEQFLQDHFEALGNIVRHRPTSGGFDLRTGWTQRLQIVEVRAIPLIGCGVELEVNLVESPDETNPQPRAIWFPRQPHDKTRRQSHLKESAFATAWTIVNPAVK